MNKIPPSEKDDDSQIEMLLTQFNPEPSKRFYDINETAPWMRKTSDKKKLQKYQLSSIKRLVFALFFVFVIVMLAGFLFFPSVRVIARQLFNAFVSTTSNQLEVKLSPTGSEKLFHDADPANFTLSIQEAEEQSNLDVREFLYLPDDLVLVGARYDSSYSAVTSLYEAPGYKLFLTQHSLKDGRDVFSIGPYAQVQIVDIHGEPGEWVTGGWKALTVTESPSSITETSITAVWDDNLPQSTLRWQSGGTMYELRTIGVARPSQSEMINLANELK